MLVRTLILALILLLSSAATCPEVVAQKRLVWEKTGGPFGGAAMSFATSESGVLFAGTSFGGVFQSSDDGRSWSRIGLDGLTVEAVQVDETGAIWAGTSTSGLLSSSDSGRSWSEIQIPHPGCSGTFGIYDLAVRPDGRLITATVCGVYRSVDGGATWTFLFFEPSVYRIFVDRDGKIYLIARDRLYRSDDEGETWAEVAVSVSFTSSPRILSMARDVSGALVLGLIRGIVRSDDDGATWHTLLEVDDQILDLAVDADGRLFAGMQRGVYRSRDGGASWEKLALRKLPVLSLMTLRSGSLLAALLNAVYRSDDGGDSWRQSVDGMAAVRVRVIASAAPNTVFASDGASIYRTRDSGLSWDVVLEQYTREMDVASNGDLFASCEEGLLRSTDDGDTWTNVAPDAVASVSAGVRGRVFAASSSELLRSMDAGENWISIYSNLERIFTSPSNSGIYAVYAGNEGSVYAAVAGGDRGLYRSVDDGEGWEKTVLDVSSVHDIVFDESTRIFVIDDGKKILGSEDGGTTWKEANGNLPQGILTAVFVAPDRSLLVGLQPLGVYRSIDSGQNWSPANEELENQWITGFASDEQGLIFAATAGGGVYRSEYFVGVGIESSLDDALNFSSLLIYPNPFSRSTTIRYTLDRSSSVKMKVFNALGQELSTVVQQHQVHGSYEYPWEPDGSMAAGLYLLTLDVDGTTHVRPFVIVP